MGGKFEICPAGVRLRSAVRHRLLLGQAPAVRSFAIATLYGTASDLEKATRTSSGSTGRFATVFIGGGGVEPFWSFDLRKMTATELAQKLMSVDDPPFNPVSTMGAAVSFVQEDYSRRSFPQDASRRSILRWLLLDAVEIRIYHRAIYQGLYHKSVTDRAWQEALVLVRVHAK